MSKPRISNSQTVVLSVATDRQLRANAIIAPAVNNALEVRDDGLYVEDFQPTGVLVQRTNTTDQLFPIFGALTPPTPFPVVYESVLGSDPSSMWDAAEPSRITIKRDAKYLISAHGRWRYDIAFGSTINPLLGWAWITKNGDVNTPLAFYSTNIETVTTTDTATLAAPAGGGTNDCLTGAYDCENVVELVAGDYLECVLMFQYMSLTAAGQVTTWVSAAPGVPTTRVSRPDLGSQFLGAVTVIA